MRSCFAAAHAGFMLLLLAASISAADPSTDRVSEVAGQVTDGSQRVTITVHPASALPGSDRQYAVDVDYPPGATPETPGSFTQPVRYFPGVNEVAVASTTSLEKRSPRLDIRPPSLRVAMSWGGTKMDYDLYVNDVYYGRPNALGGVLDRDAWASSTYVGPALENVTFAQAAPGLYSIYVNYYSDQNRNGSSSPTTIRVFVNEQQVYTATQRITAAMGLGSSLSGDGRSVWNVATVVVHGTQPGGYQVVDDTWALASMGWRDIFLPANEKPVVLFGGNLAVVPRTNVQITALSGPTTTNWFPLVRGKSAQFTASGTVNIGSSNQESRAIIGRFTSSVTSVGIIDTLGVMSGVTAGRTTVTATGAPNSVTVDILDPMFLPKCVAVGNTVAASLNYAPVNATSNWIKFLTLQGQDITVTRSEVIALSDAPFPPAWDDKIAILEQHMGADGKGMQLIIGSGVKPGMYDIEVDIGSIAPDLSGQYHPGAYGAHRMKEAQGRRRGTSGAKAQRRRHGGCQYVGEELHHRTIQAGGADQYAE